MVKSWPIIHKTRPGVGNLKLTARSELVQCSPLRTRVCIISYHCCYSYLLRRPVSASIHRSLLTQYIMNVVYLPQTCSKKSMDRQTDVIFCQNAYLGCEEWVVVNRVVSIDRSNNSQNTKCFIASIETPMTTPHYWKIVVEYSKKPRWKKRHKYKQGKAGLVPDNNVRYALSLLFFQVPHTSSLTVFKR